MSLRGRPSRSIAWAATIRAWVESRPPQTPMTTFGLADGVQPLLEPGDLDVVGLVAVERQPLGVVGHEREPVDLAAQPDVAARAAAARTRPSGTSAPSVRDPERPAGCRRRCPAAAAPAGSGRGRRRRRCAAARRGTARSRRAGRRTRRPSSGRPRTGRWSTRPGRRPRRRTPPRQRALADADQQPPVLGPGHRDRAAGEVGQHGRAGQRGLGARRHRAPTCPRRSRRGARSPGTSVAPKIRSGPNGTSAPADADRRTRGGRRRARTSAARRTRGRSAGRTWARRRAPGRGG